MTTYKNLHGSKVMDGATYCENCGARLTVGGYESYRHRDHTTGGRGPCPYVTTDEELDTMLERSRMRGEE